jgi:hypothetical protein
MQNQQTVFCQYGISSRPVMHRVPVKARCVDHMVGKKWLVGLYVPGIRDRALMFEDHGLQCFRYHVSENEDHMPRQAASGLCTV